MSRQRMGLLGLALMLALGVATVLCQADEPKKANADKQSLTAEEKDRALADLTLAYQLADLGTQAGSPEALLGAAKILSKLNGKDVSLLKVEGVKPVVGKVDAKDRPKTEEPIKEKGEMVSFAEEIKKLKKAAHALNIPRDEKLAALIDKVDERARGSLQGPAWLNGYTLGPGETNTFPFNFHGNAPARVLVRNKNGVLLKLEIYNKEGQRIGETMGQTNLEINWRPAFTRAFDVYVSNHGVRVAHYDIFKN